MIKPYKIFTIIFLVSILGFLLSSCSKNSNDPVVPNGDFDFPNMQSGIEESENRIYLGKWELNYCKDLSQVTLKGIRDLSAHYESTYLFPDPVIIVNEWNSTSEILDIDFSIYNPWFISIFDVRMIVLTDNIGHLLLNADNWTPLYDVPQGRLANPFKAFCKFRPLRVFGGHQWNSENARIKCPGSDFNITIILDACYPGNCEEPYDIADFTQGLLHENPGSDSQITVTVRDWQSDVNLVKLYCPEITGQAFIDLNHLSGSIWGTTLTNQTGAVAGKYPGFIAATSSNSGPLALYDKISIQVVDYFTGYWARTWGDTGNDEVVDITIDDSDYVYVSGQFENNCDFDPGSGEDWHGSVGSTDVFVCKYNMFGDFIWAKTWGGEGGDYGFAVAVDGSGNVYTTGTFKSFVDFDPGPDEYVVCSNNGNENIFLSKLDSNGNLEWVYTWGSSVSSNEGNDLYVDENDNVYLIGEYSRIVDFDPGPEYDVFISKGYEDVFLLKIDGTGEYLWTKSWGGINTDLVYEIYAHDSNIYINGFSSFEADLDPGPGVYELPDGGKYVTRFNEDGIFLEALEAFAEDISIANNNQLFCTDIFAGTQDFDPGPGEDIHTSNGYNDAAICGFDAFGEYIGTYTWGNTGNDTINQVCSYYPRYIYAAGNITSRVDLDPGPDTAMYGAPYGSSFYISRFGFNFDYMGSIAWNEIVNLNRMIIDDNGQLFLAGTYKGEVDFDPGIGEDIHEATSMDAFILVLPEW